MSELKGITVDVDKTLDAEHIGSVTLVGYLHDKFPYPSGNCMDLFADGEYYRIVNFSYENLEELIKRGLEYPVKIIPISKRQAIIHDSRIPFNWYDDKWCTVCCPDKLLPIPQQLKYNIQEQTGHRTVTEHSIQYKPIENPLDNPIKEIKRTLHKDWTIEVCDDYTGDDIISEDINIDQEMCDILTEEVIRAFGFKKDVDTE